MGDDFFLAAQLLDDPVLDEELIVSQKLLLMPAPHPSEISHGRQLNVGSPTIDRDSAK
jgi:hypothetical protein